MFFSQKGYFHDVDMAVPEEKGMMKLETSIAQQWSGTKIRVIFGLKIPLKDGGGRSDFDY